MVARQQTPKPDQYECTVRAPGLPNPRRQGRAYSRHRLPKLRTDRQLHLKSRAFAEDRFHPNASTVHLHDLFCDGESQTRAALRLGDRAVHLMEVLKDSPLVLLRYARSCVRYAEREVAVDRFG